MINPNLRMKKIFLSLLSVACVFTLFAQEKSVSSFKAENLNWYNKDLKTDKIAGVSTDLAYNNLLSGMKTKKTVVVAVIDGGVDVDHEDLAGKIWINNNEIPNNKVDDDGNGYVDDIHGWNFIGNKSGTNVNYENYEYTRILKKETDPDYKKAKEYYDKEFTQRKKERENLIRFIEIYTKAKAIILENTGIDVKSKDDLEKVKSKNEAVVASKDFLLKRYKMGLTEDGLNRLKKQNDEYINYYLNTNYDARVVISDDPNNLDDRYYGNSDVKGPRVEHGTMVAGIIAANRNNNIGINGIASDVRIMALRTTPSGDERDKDVALAIMYAVDNGANIINMSFGKPFSPQKEFVDKAVKYAEQKGVLLIHSAGNSGENIDEIASYPTDAYLDGTEATNWLSVGASQLTIDKELPAIFSNYGARNVDIFAPGVDIVSLDSSNMYNMHSGTSFSAPVVTGVAALILSYYPDLTPQQLIELLMESSYKVTKPKSFLIPNLKSEKREKASFTQLSKSGGIVNAYSALALAKEKYSK